MDAIAAFNALPAERLEADLLACCAVPAWAARIAAAARTVRETICRGGRRRRTRLELG